jgi:hypothetical protein
MSPGGGFGAAKGAAGFEMKGNGMKGTGGGFGGVSKGSGFGMKGNEIGGDNFGHELDQGDQGYGQGW